MPDPTDRPAPSLKPLLIALSLLTPAFVYYRLFSLYRAPIRLRLGDPPPIALVLQELRSPIIPTMALVGLILLVYLEWRHASLSRTLEALWKRRILAGVLLTGLFVILSSHILLPGYPGAFDALHDVAHAWSTYETFRHAQLSIWSNYGYLGYPFNQFKGLLYEYSAGAITLLLAGNPYLATKIALVGFHVLGGWTMFALVRRWRGSTGAALVAGMAWVLSLYYSQSVVKIGRYHMSPLFTLMPLALLVTEDLVQQRGPGRVLRAALLAVSLGALVWTHALFGTIFTGMTLLYGFLRVALLDGDRRHALLWLSIGHGLGALIAIPRIVPIFVEKDLVLAVTRYLEPQFSVGVAEVGEVLLFRDSNITAGYFGLSIVALAGVGLAYVTYKRQKRAVPMIAILLVGLYLSFGPRYLPFDVIFQNIPLGYFVYGAKHSGFYLMYPLLAICAFAGVGFEAILPLWRRLNLTPKSLAPTRLGLILFAVMALDLLPPTFLININDYRYQFPSSERQAASAWIRDQPAEFSRVLDVESNWPGVEMVELGRPGFVASHEEATPRAGELLEIARQELADEISDTHMLTDRGLRLAYLMNIGYVLASDLLPGPAVKSFGPGQTQVLEIVDRSALVATTRPTEVSGLDEAISLLDDVHIEPQRNVADWLPVLDDLPTPSHAFDSDPDNLTADVLGHTVEPQRVEMSFELSQPAFVQLSWAYYPYLAVQLDNERIAAHETAFGMIGFWADAGVHQVTLRPFLSPVRRTTGAVALGALASCAVLIGIGIIRQRHAQS